MRTGMLKFSIICLFLVGFSIQGFAKPVLEDVTSYSKEGAVVAELLFTEKVDTSKVKVDFINQTVQIDLDGLEMKRPTYYQKIDNSRVKSIYTYKPNDSTVRARIIQHKPFLAKELKNHIEIESIDNKVIFRVLDPTAKLPEKILQPTESEFMGVAPNTFSDESSLADGEPLAEKKIKLNVEERTSALAKINADKIFDQSKKISKNEMPKSENKIPESEIPLFTQADKKEKVVESSYSRLFLSVGFILIFALGLAQFTKWWSRKNTKSLDTSKVRVLTQHHLGPKKSLMIVQVAGESLLLGVTDTNISMLKTLSLLDEEVPEISGQGSFSSAMKRELNFVDDENPKSSSAGSEDFAISQIKDIVSEKLKSMRSI